ncbi:MAG: DNA-directed RNA polymerase subunit A' [DPANN group archaeon]|nr:DNA-directed RNA polymerase subunit A' [DPANN group archaeon]
MVSVIEKINFKMMSPQMIQKLGAINVTNSEVYDADAYPVEGGVMDPHMGVIDPGMRCKTCGGRSGECQGHFGYINLAKPVLNILFIKQIKTVLTYTCEHCGELLFSKDLLKTSKLSKIKPSKDCPVCTKANRKLVFERPQTFKRDKQIITPEEIREHFEKIKDSDVKYVGLAGGRPEWMILTVMPVPSITTRPSITLTTGERSEDDLTHKLVDVIRTNQRLASNLEIGAPEFILDDLWELLQYHVTTFFNNEVSGLPPARHRSGRQLKTLSQRLKSKDGRFRNNLTGKRVNFSARTVVSPDPNIGVNEVGVPAAITRELTVPARATKDNLKELKEMLNRGPNQIGGANYVIRPDGLRKKITDMNKDLILEEFDVDFILERHINNGDIVLFNRQPSLHRMSIMAHKVVVTQDKTFKLNLVVCKPYNADFDGDEMNLHVPQSAEARAEAKQLMLVEENLRSPRFGGPIIGCDQDYISGSYILTKKGVIINKKDVAQLMYAVGISEDLNKEEYTGKEVMSMVLPKGLNIEYKTGFCLKCSECKKGKCVSDAYLVIEDGNLICGVFDSKAIASFKGAILDRIDLEFGHKVAIKFLEQLTRLTLEFIMRDGFSISVSDMDISNNTQKQIDGVIDKSLIGVNKLIDKYDAGEIVPNPGRSMEETLETLVMSELQSILTRAQVIISDNAVENSAVIMAKTGARGSMQNLTFMAGLIGQEAISGGRIFRGYRTRTLTHFKQNDFSAESHGFVRSSFKKGLNPIEFFFEAMKGREGIMDSSLKTRISGYMQRRLVNALQDNIVQKDISVRDGAGTIIQFLAGEDGIDPAKSDNGVLINLKRI